MSDALDHIKHELKSGKLIVGTKDVMRELRAGTVGRVFLTSNCPQSVREDIKHASALSAVTIEDLPVPNDELGVICKMQFSISVLGERK